MIWRGMKTRKFNLSLHAVFYLNGLFYLSKLIKIARCSNKDNNNNKEELKLTIDDIFEDFAHINALLNLLNIT